MFPRARVHVPSPGPSNRSTSVLTCPLTHNDSLTLIYALMTLGPGINLKHTPSNTLPFSTPTDAALSLPRRAEHSSDISDRKMVKGNSDRTQRLLEAPRNASAKFSESKPTWGEAVLLRPIAPLYGPLTVSGIVHDPPRTGTFGVPLRRFYNYPTFTGEETKAKSRSMSCPRWSRDLARLQSTCSSCTP